MPVLLRGGLVIAKFLMTIRDIFPGIQMRSPGTAGMVLPLLNPSVPLSVEKPDSRPLAPLIVLKVVTNPKRPQVKLTQLYLAGFGLVRVIDLTLDSCLFSKGEAPQGFRHVAGDGASRYL